MPERLQKVMAAAGFGSRRHCEMLITQGKVKLNGSIVTELGTKAEPGVDRIEVEGACVTLEKKVYLLLNKPSGYVTTRSDPHADRTVMHLLKGVKESIYPVGRLDVDTEGALFFTNDGELAYRLTHPKYHIDKGYKAMVFGLVNEFEIDRLRKGVQLEDGITARAKVRILETDPKRRTSVVELIIHEGKNRQVKRMFDAVGHRVLKLKRLSFGELDLTKLSVGNYRMLTKQEVVRLKALCGL